MQLVDTPKNIISYLSLDYPEIPDVLSKADKSVQTYKGSIQPFQAAVLYFLASKHVPTYGQILEVGTGLGYSAFVMASARPSAHIITLNPTLNERLIAAGVLVDFDVEILPYKSRDFYVLDETSYDLIFIDGNHNDIAFDCDWYKRLTPNGLIVFHDYSPEDAWSAQPIVYNFLNNLKNKKWGNESYMFADDGKVGMIAWLRHGIQQVSKKQIASNIIQNQNG